MSSRECNAFEAQVVPESGGEFCHVPGRGTRLRPQRRFVSHRFTLRSLLTTASARQDWSGIALGVEAQQQVVQLREELRPAADRHRRTSWLSGQPADNRSGLAGDEATRRDIPVLHATLVVSIYVPRGQ